MLHTIFLRVEHVLEPYEKWSCDSARGSMVCVCCGTGIIRLAVAESFFRSPTTRHHITDDMNFVNTPLISISSNSGARHRLLPFPLVYLSLVHTRLPMSLFYCQLSSNLPITFVLVSFFVFVLLNRSSFLHVYPASFNSPKLTPWEVDFVSFELHRPIKPAHTLCQACRSSLSYSWPRGSQEPESDRLSV